ncbi:unnamed protein product [Moneuplotes crassus]|uniref:Uncharacterized protein n=1 Tax=Euplotes crassus TaxID=5936 RepID=A0AAD1XAV8_EUPCR|nr:unnamed protein product [Moneuplotes crassus]
MDPVKNKSSRTRKKNSSHGANPCEGFEVLPKIFEPKDLQYFSKENSENAKQGQQEESVLEQCMRTGEKMKKILMKKIAKVENAKKENKEILENLPENVFSDDESKKAESLMAKRYELNSKIQSSFDGKELKSIYEALQKSQSEVNQEYINASNTAQIKLGSIADSIDKCNKHINKAESKTADIHISNLINKSPEESPNPPASLVVSELPNLEYTNCEDHNRILDQLQTIHEIQLKQIKFELTRDPQLFQKEFSHPGEEKEGKQNYSKDDIDEHSGIASERSSEAKRSNKTKLLQGDSGAAKSQHSKRKDTFLDVNIANVKKKFGDSSLSKNKTKIKAIKPSQSIEGRKLFNKKDIKTDGSEESSDDELSRRSNKKPILSREEIKIEEAPASPQFQMNSTQLSQFRLLFSDVTDLI